MPNGSNQGEDPIRLRLPTLEVFSALNGGAFASQGTPLTVDERRDAEAIFQSSINLDLVRIVEAPVVNAPTTLGNMIRVAPGGTVLARSTLIHELTHVWQYQTKGTAYLSDSLLHQTIASITTGSRNGAYAVTITRGKSIHAYTAEQQAVIVENYFTIPGLRSDPDYRRMIEEVRAARPIPIGMILNEAAHGPGGNNPRLFPPAGNRPEPFAGEGGQIPQLRFEF